MTTTVESPRKENIVRGLRILLVDDEPDVREPIALLLGLDGHIVQQASCGNEALEILAKNNFDLLITDYRMDGMSGDQLAGHVKKQIQTLPILMLTGSVHAQSNLGSSVDGIFYKPCSLADMRAAIARVCSTPE